MNRHSFLSFLILFLAVSPAWAQGPVSGTVTASVQANGSGPYSSDTFSHTVASGTDRCLVVIARGLNNSSGNIPTVSTVVFNTSESLTEQVEQTQSGGPMRSSVSIWTLADPTVTTANVVVTFDVSDVASTAVHAIDYTNCHQTTPAGATAGNNANSSASSTSITTANANSMIVVGVTFRGADGDPFSASNGETELADGQSGTSNSADIAFWAAELFKASAGAQTVGATHSSNDRWAIAALELREPGGAARRLMVISENRPSEQRAAGTAGYAHTGFPGR